MRLDIIHEENLVLCNDSDSKKYPLVFVNDKNGEIWFALRKHEMDFYLPREKVHNPGLVNSEDILKNTINDNSFYNHTLCI